VRAPAGAVVVVGRSYMERALLFMSPPDASSIEKRYAVEAKAGGVGQAAAGIPAGASGCAGTSRQAWQAAAVRGRGRHSRAGAAVAGAAGGVGQAAVARRRHPLTQVVVCGGVVGRRVRFRWAEEHATHNTQARGDRGRRRYTTPQDTGRWGPLLS